MTGRERLVAAARGGETDRVPTISWPCPDAAAGDALIVPEADNVIADEDRAVLVEVANPFGQALAQGLNPHDHQTALVDATRAALDDALQAGADGVFYVLYCGSASPFLEADQALLGEIADARLNVLFVVADDGPLDFARDLPAHVFAWDAPTTGISSAAVRQFRRGAQASADGHSEIRLVSPGPIASLIER